MLLDDKPSGQASAITADDWVTFDASSSMPHSRDPTPGRSTNSSETPSGIPAITPPVIPYYQPIGGSPSTLANNPSSFTAPIQQPHPRSYSPNPPLPSPQTYGAYPLSPYTSTSPGASMPSGVQPKSAQGPETAQGYSQVARPSSGTGFAPTKGMGAIPTGPLSTGAMGLPTRPSTSNIQDPFSSLVAAASDSISGKPMMLQASAQSKPPSAPISVAMRQPDPSLYQRPPRPMALSPQLPPSPLTSGLPYLSKLPSDGAVQPGGKVLQGASLSLSSSPEPYRMVAPSLQLPSQQQQPQKLPFNAPSMQLPQQQPTPPSVSAPLSSADFDLFASLTTPMPQHQGRLAGTSSVVNGPRMNWNTPEPTRSPQVSPGVARGSGTSMSVGQTQAAAQKPRSEYTQLIDLDLELLTGFAALGPSAGAQPSVAVNQDLEPPPPSYASVFNTGQTQQSASPLTAGTVEGGMRTYPDGSYMEAISRAESEGAGDTVSSGGRTPCAEIRLPPLRPKTSLDLRLLAATRGLLLAGPASPGAALVSWRLAGGRLTNIAPGCSGMPCEDADAAPCAALRMPENAPSEQVCCMHIDELRGYMWTGHERGIVCRWSLPAAGENAIPVFEMWWAAHCRGSVTAIAATQWGSLITGTKNGTMKMWTGIYAPSGRNPVKVCQMRKVERRTRLKPHSCVKHLAVTAGGRIVWSAGKAGLLLWDAAKGEFIGMISANAPTPANVNMITETEMPTYIHPDRGLDPETLATSAFRCRPTAYEDGDESQDEANSLGHQVVRGVTGAAKALNKWTRRIRENIAADVNQDATDPSVGAKPVDASLGRSNIKGLVASYDGGVFVGYKHGLLEKYTEGGKLLFAHTFSPGIRCLTVVGRQLWVGQSHGRILVLDCGSGGLLRMWWAHMASVASIAQLGSIIYSLGRDGSLRGWPLSAPSESALADWRARTFRSLEVHSLAVLATTWNVNECKVTPDSLALWIGRHAYDKQLVTVALQEVELNTGAVAMDRAYSYLARNKLEEGSPTAKWWAAQIAGCLGPQYIQVGLRQMAGILSIVYAHTELAPYVGEVLTASVACGIGGIAGNKGATAISFSIRRRRATFISSHFAAHQEHLEQRNADYARIAKHLRFSNDIHRLQASQGAEVLPAPGQRLSPLTSGLSQGPLAASISGDLEEGPVIGYEHGTGLRSAELLIWAGDFNYRIDAPYAGVLAHCNARTHLDLLPLDQCRNEIAKGVIFHHLIEPPIRFLPTYRFDKNVASQPNEPLPYDSSEKQRIPSWTDRVFFRGSLNDELSTDGVGTEGSVQVIASQSVAAPYDSVMEVIDSDHKPVVCHLDVQLPAYRQDEKRSLSLELLRSIAGPDTVPPAPLVVNVVGAVHLRPGCHARVLVSVSTTAMVASGSWHFLVQASGPGPQAGPLPPWLCVSPARFVLGPSERSQFLTLVIASDVPLERTTGGGLGFEVLLWVTPLGMVGEGQWGHNPEKGLGASLSVVVIR